MCPPITSAAVCTPILPVRLMLILSESKEKMGFTWMELEAMKDEDGKDAVKKIDTAVAKGYVHKNTAARRKSQMTKKLNAAE